MSVFSYNFREQSEFSKKPPKPCRQQARSVHEIKRTIKQDNDSVYYNKYYDKKNSIGNDQQIELQNQKFEENIEAQEKDFIPFIKERDQLGKLISRPFSLQQKRLRNSAEKIVKIKKIKSYGSQEVITRAYITEVNNLKQQYQSENNENQSKQDNKSQQGTSKKFTLNSIYQESLEFQNIQNYQNIQINQSLKRDFKKKKRVDENYSNNLQLHLYNYQNIKLKRQQISQQTIEFTRKIYNQFYQSRSQSQSTRTPQINQQNPIQTTTVNQYINPWIPQIQNPPQGHYDVSNYIRVLQSQPPRTFISTIGKEQKDMKQKHLEGEKQKIKLKQIKFQDSIKAATEQIKQSNDSDQFDPLKSIKIDKATIKNVMNQPQIKQYTEGRKVSSINLVDNWTERELNYKFKGLMMDTKSRFRGIRNRLSEWPEQTMRNHQKWLMESDEKDIIFRKEWNKQFQNEKNGNQNQQELRYERWQSLIQKQNQL